MTGVGSERIHERMAEAARVAELGNAAARRGANGQAAAYYDQALALLELDAPTVPLIDILRWKGTALRELGDMNGADALYRRSLAAAVEVNYVTGQAHALNCLAILAHRRGDMGEAETLYNEAAYLAAQASEHSLLGMIGQNLGVMASIRGDAERALLRFRMSLCAFVEAGDDYAVSELLNNLGMLFTQQGRFDEAGQVFGRALAVARSCGALMVEGVVELNRAEMFAAAGRWAEAETSCARSMMVAEQRGDRLRVAEALKLRATIECHRRELQSAARTLEDARRLADEAADALLSAQVLRQLGDVWS
ncbi:MAG: tetratricopeptide repeat protein, partial [Chloroflexota bacterium]|nr:tetratricopeptide repeat protein [Chloroflexota bacterium]